MRLNEAHNIFMALLSQLRPSSTLYWTNYWSSSSARLYGIKWLLRHYYASKIQKSHEKPRTTASETYIQPENVFSIDRNDLPETKVFEVCAEILEQIIELRTFAKKMKNNHCFWKRFWQIFDFSSHGYNILRKMIPKNRKIDLQTSQIEFLGSYLDCKRVFRRPTSLRRKIWKIDISWWKGY